MTPWIRKNSPGSGLRAGFRNEPYITINFILAGVILLIFIYSGFFSPDKDNYPVVCIHERLTGEQCASCGLSHSFSLDSQRTDLRSIRLESVWVEGVYLFCCPAYYEGCIHGILPEVP